MRRGVLLGSIVAVLLVSATAALVVPRIGTAPDDSRNKQNVAIAPGGGPAPAAVPALQNPGARSVTPVPPSFDVVKVGPAGTTVIAGRAEPGSRVTVRDGDKVIGEITADRRGEWVLVPDQPIRPGDRLLSLEAVNPESGAAVRSDETVALSITPPTSGGKGETALAVLVPRDGAGAARVLQRPDGSSPTAPGAADKPVALSMDAADYDGTGRVVLSGRAGPGATVQIYLDNRLVATATADGAGAWSATTARTVAPGSGELRLDQLAQDGHVLSALSCHWRRRPLRT